jgi:hypothetical protein
MRKRWIPVAIHRWEGCIWKAS